MTTRLDAIKRRLEAATPGPWTDDGDFGVASPADAALIAHAPQDLRDLLELAEAARNVLNAAYGWSRETEMRELEKMRAVLSRLDAPLP